MSAALGLTAILLGAAVVVFVALRYRNLAGPLLVGFGLRAAMAVVDVVFVLPGHSDSVVVDFYAHYNARNGVLGTLRYLQTGSALYTWFCSFFYALFDRSPLMMQGVNALFGALIALNVGRLAAHLGGSARLVRQAAWVVAAFPSLVYFSAVQLREVAVAYPLSLGVLYLAFWYRDRRWQQIAVAVPALLLSMAFHSGTLAVLLAFGAFIVGSWIRSLFSRGGRKLGQNSAALVAGAAAVVFVFASGFGMHKFEPVQEGGIERFARTQSDFAQGRTAYLQDLHPESPADLVLQAPIRLVYFLFAPFPWMLSAGSDVLGVVDSFFFLVLFYRVWRQRRVLAGRKDSLVVLAMFGAMVFTFALAVSNYGTALRHRNKMLPLLIATAFSVPWRRPRSAVSASATAPRLAARSQPSR